MVFAEFRANTNIHGYAFPVFALNEITKNHPEIIDKSIQKSIACYQSIEQKSLEIKNAKYTDSAGDTARTLLNKEGSHPVIMQCILSDEDIKPVEDPIDREIDKFAIGIDNIKNLRRKYYFEAKEKLGNVARLLSAYKELG